MVVYVVVVGSMKTELGMFFFLKNLIIGAQPLLANDVVEVIISTLTTHKTLQL